MTKVTQMNLDEDGGTGRRRIHLREISGDSASVFDVFDFLLGGLAACEDSGLDE